MKLEYMKIFGGKLNFSFQLSYICDWMAKKKNAQTQRYILFLIITAFTCLNVQFRYLLSPQAIFGAVILWYFMWVLILVHHCSVWVLYKVETGMSH